MCTETSVFKYKPERESRHAWRHYVARGDYELARRYALGCDAHAVEAVLTKQAEQLMAQVREDGEQSWS
jgi:hypothetical protein